MNETCKNISCEDQQHFVLRRQSHVPPIVTEKNIVCFYKNKYIVCSDRHARFTHGSLSVPFETVFPHVSLSATEPRSTIILEENLECFLKPKYCFSFDKQARFSWYHGSRSLPFVQLFYHSQRTLFLFFVHASAFAYA